MANEKLAPAVFAFPEVAAPGTPPPGHVYLYFKADGKAYIKDDAGTESDLTGGGASLPIDLTTDVTGALPIANGGTNGATATAAFDNLAPTTTKGDLIAHNGTDNVRLPVGTDGYRLTGRASDSEGLAWEADDVIAILRDEKTSGTAGGTSSATTWNARALNTEDSDPYSIVTISSDQFTPITGDYELFAAACAGINANVTNHRLRLYNVTGAASVKEGGNSSSPADARTIATVFATFTANGTDAYRIDHYTSTGIATSGLGRAVSDGSPECYLQIELRRLSR